MVTKPSRIREWKGGALRIFVRTYDRPGLPEGRLVEQENPVWREYAPLGNGWAAPIELAPLQFLPKPGWPSEDGLEGVVLKFAIRKGRVVCTEIGTIDHGPALTPALLRKAASSVTHWTRFCALLSLVRLFEHDEGMVAGEAAMRSRSLFPPEEETYSWEQLINPDAPGEYRRTVGRPPLPDEFLRRVADLYREADQLGQPRRAYIAQHIPGYSEAAINNWIRKARRREFLGKAPRDRVGGERRKGEAS